MAKERKSTLEELNERVEQLEKQVARINSHLDSEIARRLQVLYKLETRAEALSEPSHGNQT